MNQSTLQFNRVAVIGMIAVAIVMAVSSFGIVRAIAVTSRTCSSLRVATAKNGQAKRVRWAEEYLISRKFGAGLIEVGRDAQAGGAQTGSTPS
ncbi:MAG: hypothetical protein WB810_14800 [Candidatus Cybelea sp.]